MRRRATQHPRGRFASSYDIVRAVSYELRSKIHTGPALQPRQRSLPQCLPCEAARKLATHQAHMRSLVLYAARAGTACGVAAVLPLLCVALPRLNAAFALPLFCPIAACVTVAPRSLGAALKNGTHVVSGVCAGGLLVAAALAVAESVRKRSDGFSADAATYIMLVVLSVPCLYPAFPPLASKFAMNNVIISLFTWRVYGGDALQPLRLALTTTVGVTVALAVCAAPWPSSRACDDTRTQLCAVEKLSAALCTLLARGFVQEEQSFRVTTALSESHRAAAAALQSTLRSLEEQVSWEVWAFSAPVPNFRTRLRVLHDTLVACDGAVLALADARAAEATHSRAVGRARLSSATGDLNRIDELLADPLRELSGAVDAALRAASDVYGGKCSVTTLDETETALKAAGDSFDAALLSARVQVYYGPRMPDLVAAGSASYGAPVEHYTVFYAWQLLVSCALQAMDSSRTHANERSARRKTHAGTECMADWAAFVNHFSAPFLLAPDRVRLIYATKLVASVVAAAWLGQLTCGSGLWAAITAQIVGGRDNLFSGGSFRVATSRLTGTVLGAMWGYVLLILFGDAPFGVVLPLLAAWTALFALVRASPRTAYLGLVAKFTPLIIALDSTRTSDKRLFAYRRIEQNLIGILAFVLIEFVVAPRRASSLLLSALADVMRATAAVVTTAWDPVLLGARCVTCASSDTASTVDAQAALTAKLTYARTLLAEAGEEPALLRPAALLPPIQSILSMHDGALGSMLSLMQTAATASAAHGTATLHADIRDETARLRAALRELYCSIAADLEAGVISRGVIHASVAVTQAMAAFESCYTEALGRHREAHRDHAVQIVPTSTVLPLDTLIWTTRQLIQLTDGVEAAVRVALRTKHAELLQLQAAPQRLSVAISDHHVSVAAENSVSTRCACGAPI